MNKKAQVFLAFMLGIVCFVIGMALAYPMRTVLDESMTSMNCTTNYLINTSIDNQDRAVCTQIDMFLPLLIGTLFGIAGMLLARMVVG